MAFVEMYVPSRKEVTRECRAEWWVVGVVVECDDQLIIVSMIKPGIRRRA